MPRPKKWRRVCCLPENSGFGPLNGCRHTEDRVLMAVDEYETIRLIDYEGCDQEKCARQMDIARTTVQGIYFEARRKLADALVNGKILWIQGGEYMLCEGQGACCGGSCPFKKSENESTKNMEENE